MKKSQILILALIFAAFLILASYSFIQGYLNGPDHIVFDTVTGTIEEYNDDNGGGSSAASIKLIGKDILYRVSDDIYGHLALQEHPSSVGENVEILYENNIRGGRYSIAGISTDTWSASAVDEYLKHWETVRIFAYLFGAFIILVGILLDLFLFMVTKKSNELLDGNHTINITNPAFLTPTPAIRMATAEGRVIFAQQYYPLYIMVKRVFGATELIVNGMVYAEKKGVMEFRYELDAFVNNIPIKVTFQPSGLMCLYANGKLLDSKWRVY